MTKKEIFEIYFTTDPEMRSIMKPVIIGIMNAQPALYKKALEE